MTRSAALLALATLGCPRPPVRETAPPPPALDVPRVIALCREQFGNAAQWSISDVGGVTLFRCGLQKVETICVDTGSLRPPRKVARRMP